MAGVAAHHSTRSKQRAAKGRSGMMSSCQKKAAEANLQDIERKDCLTACHPLGIVLKYSV